jgi:DNA-binding LytR/AlgR family response regulator
MKLKALIADDEPLARERLRFLLSSDEDVEIVSECRNGSEVTTALKQTQMDVLFLDIQMPGIGGFEVIEQVGTAHMPVIVFVTAHNEFALKAFEVHALDYLTKPVEPERLRAALARVKERIASHLALLAGPQRHQGLLCKCRRYRVDRSRRLLLLFARRDQKFHVARANQATRKHARSEEIRSGSSFRDRQPRSSTRGVPRRSERRFGSSDERTETQDE